MKQSIKIGAVIALTLGLAGCSTLEGYSQRLEEYNQKHNAPPNHTIGQIFRNSFVLDKWNTAIPLPAGEWKLVGYSSPKRIRDTQLYEGDFVSPGKQYNAVFAQMGNEQPGFISMSYSLPGGLSWSWSRDEFCMRDDLFHMTTRSNNDRAINCWGITWWQIDPNEDDWGDEWKQFLDYHKTNVIKLPAKALVVSYKKAQTDKKFINIYYGFNPEKKGIDRYTYWDSDTYQTDKKKADYINMLKSWGRDWNDKVDTGIKGKLPKQTIQTTDSGSDEVTNKLKKLKKLANDGIITNADYEKKKQAILDSL